MGVAKNKEKGQGLPTNSAMIWTSDPQALVMGLPVAHRSRYKLVPCQESCSESITGLTDKKLFLLRPVSKDGNSWLLLQIGIYKCKTTGIMNNQRNMKPPKEQNKAPVTDHKKMDLWTAWQKIQNNIVKGTQWVITEHRQLKEIRKMIDEHN